MANFSQRKGIKPLQKPLQLDGLDEELRNSLWNCLHICYWSHWEEYQYVWTEESKALNTLAKVYYYHYFKVPIDSADKYFPDALAHFRSYFFAAEWNEVFDFIEFAYSHGPKLADFKSYCNGVLERENSGYRFIDGQFAEITSKDELAAIEEASQIHVAPVAKHIHRAVELLSDRKHPDYRNSIKESISAVESLCQIMSKDDKATLGKALAVLEKSSQIHGALKTGFAALYGYTNEADGIRHAMLDEPNVSFTDAKYMLVSCSAFVNYLVGKASDAGISLAAP